MRCGAAYGLFLCNITSLALSLFASINHGCSLPLLVVVDSLAREATIGVRAVRERST